MITEDHVIQEIATALHYLYQDLKSKHGVELDMMRHALWEYAKRDELAATEKKGWVHPMGDDC